MALDIDKETIRVLPYNSAWPDLFQREAARLASVFEGLPCEIEHIGSTSVRGLLAKGIVDIAVRLDSADRAAALAPRLEGLGYRHFGELVAPGCHYFCRGTPREYSLHVVDRTTDHWERWITFRDTLRADPNLCREYEELKRHLLETCDQQRERYTFGKTDFVERVLRDALPPGKPQSD